MNRCKMRFVAELGIDPFYIMIVHKIVKIQITHILQIFNGMCDFKIIMVVMPAVQGFMQSIVCYTVQSIAVNPTAVITVDNLSHEPEILFYFIGSTAQSMHKVKIQDICSIQTNTINIKFRHPETYHITDIILYFRIALIQFYQKIISSPVFVGKTVIILCVSAEIYIAIPVDIAGMFPVFLDIFKSKEITSGVIEDTIENHTDSFFMAGSYKVRKIFIGSQTGIQFLIICSFIAMSYTLK